MKLANFFTLLIMLTTIIVFITFVSMPSFGPYANIRFQDR